LSDDAPIGALIVATPVMADPVNEGVENAHVTMLWFGEAANLPGEVIDGVRDAITQIVPRYAEFDADVGGVGLIGPDKVSVLLLESSLLVEIRNELAADPYVREAWLSAERQFPWWVCHLTVGYDGTVPQDPPESVRIGALGLWVAGQHESFPFMEQVGDGEISMAELDTFENLTSSIIPPVHTPDDFPLALHFAETHPSARWYVEKRAAAMGLLDRIPSQWGGQ
jgi:hypothetical protein